MLWRGSAPKAPLCKGSWLTVGETEGLYLRYEFATNLQ